MQLNRMSGEIEPKRQSHRRARPNSLLDGPPSASRGSRQAFLNPRPPSSDIPSVETAVRMRRSLGRVCARNALTRNLGSRVGESFVAAENINLKHGDEITEEIVKTFISNNTYNIKIYETDGDGNKRGNGVGATRYGRDIKKMINLQKFNQIKTHKYFYVQK